MKERIMSLLNDLITLKCIPYCPLCNVLAICDDEQYYCPECMSTDLANYLEGYGYVQDKQSLYKPMLLLVGTSCKVNDERFKSETITFYNVKYDVSQLIDVLMDAIDQAELS